MPHAESGPIFRFFHLFGPITLQNKDFNPFFGPSILTFHSGPVREHRNPPDTQNLHLEASNKMIEDYNALEVERENISEKSYRLGYEDGFTDSVDNNWSQAIETKAWLNHIIEAKL